MSVRGGGASAGDTTADSTGGRCENAFAGCSGDESTSIGAFLFPGASLGASPDKIDASTFSPGKGASLLACKRSLASIAGGSGGGGLLRSPIARGAANADGFGAGERAGGGPFGFDGGVGELFPAAVGWRRETGFGALMYDTIPGLFCQEAAGDVFGGKLTLAG